uniref:STAS domain-containing protein n=1 Tax=Roseihalotalea indica TaxID=2867963 RepID=A0AA49JG25_9BACT|nr:STAS domain-containing protein [Tunicatimonas sp. TK19036]
MHVFQEIVSREQGPQECRFVIEKSLQTEDIQILKQELLASAETHAAVHIIIRKLDALELQALQWIMAFQRAAQTEGRRVLLELELSKALQTLVDQSGLASKFNWK